ncbi:hypothetical protein OPV22_004377 [Ensete ventricosum]|uniref:Uncharacterized protein n=1 Tax=Ensete ventricosum TaxID=4639 RepID=A0AAV8S3E8_ENSVE|nr:hypothetical protein OPV22_004377 [Ensete ventricosum]
MARSPWGNARGGGERKRVWKRGRVRRRHRRAEKPPRSFVDPPPASRCLRDVILPYHRVVTACLASPRDFSIQPQPRKSGHRAPPPPFSSFEDEGERSGRRKKGCTRRKENKTP